MPLNQFGQPIGAPLPEWKGAKTPDFQLLDGKYCRLESLNIDRHSADLFEAYSTAEDGRDWTYLTAGPFPSLEEYRQYLSTVVDKSDPMHFAIIDASTAKPVGTTSFMRIQPEIGVIEIGNVTYSPKLKRTRMATEVMSLLINAAFGLGYRRLEWKCDSLNAPSRAAAPRLGFTFEGVFRNALVTRGRTRDTAWYSIIDSEYPKIAEGYNRWLDEDNFDENGQQKQKLGQFLQPATNSNKF